MHPRASCPFLPGARPRSAAGGLEAEGEPGEGRGTTACPSRSVSVETGAETALAPEGQLSCPQPRGMARRRPGAPRTRHRGSRRSEAPPCSPAGGLGTAPDHFAPVYSVTGGELAGRTHRGRGGVEPAPSRPPVGPEGTSDSQRIVVVPRVPVGGLETGRGSLLPGSAGIERGPVTLTSRVRGGAPSLASPGPLRGPEGEGMRGERGTAPVLEEVN